MTYYESSGEFTVERLFWETIVDHAHIKYNRALKADNALLSNGIDNQRLYRIGSGGNEVVDVPHDRYLLVPKGRASTIGDITQCFIRLPFIESDKVTQKYRDRLRLSGQLLSGDDGADIPTGDIFVEAVKSTGESMRLLFTPDGPEAYADAADITLDLRTSSDDIAHYFAIGASLDTAALQQEYKTTWPDPDMFTRILAMYDVHPQETAGPNSSSSAA